MALLAFFWLLFSTSYSGYVLEPFLNCRFYNRRYQLELCKKALEENIIVYLETGCGKTHIAVLLMYELGHLIRKPHESICVFLAPTVHLVQQVTCCSPFFMFAVWKLMYAPMPRYDL